MFYIAYYQTLIKNTPFPTPCLQPNKHQQHISNHHVSNQPPTSTTLLQHHVSNQTNISPNYTSQPPNQQLQHHISNQPTNRQHQQHISNNTFPTNTFQTARFKHLYYTPRNAPSFRFQPPPSGTWFSAITPLPPVILLQLVFRTGKRVYRDQSLFICSEISDEAIIV